MTHRTIPNEVLLDWLQKANPDNPSETRGDGIPIMEVVLSVACFLVVSLRVYTRLFQTKTFGWDDAFIIFNLVRQHRCRDVLVIRANLSIPVASHRDGCVFVSWLVAFLLFLIKLTCKRTGSIWMEQTSVRRSSSDAS
jgi:hypothetical protein